MNTYSSLHKGSIKVPWTLQWPLLILFALLCCSRSIFLDNWLSVLLLHLASECTICHKETPSLVTERVLGLGSIVVSEKIWTVSEKTRTVTEKIRTVTKKLGLSQQKSGLFYMKIFIFKIWLKNKIKCFNIL